MPSQFWCTSTHDSRSILLLSSDSLEGVVNLTTEFISSAIQLSWQPPFSLNLTTVKPDIVYCVDVFNITDGETERDHLISNCSVFQLCYTFTVDDPDPNDIFQFIVTPRSNIEGARNGTSSNINATYIHPIEGRYIRT